MRIAALAILFVPSLGFADDVHVDVDVDVNVRPTEGLVPAVIAAPPVRESRLGSDHWEFGLLFDAGQFRMGDVDCAQVGLRAEIGRQLGPVRLGIEGTAASVEDSPNDDGGGELLRGGVSLRVRAISMGAPTRLDPSPREMAWFIESGVGIQRLTWETGDPDQRWDLMVGTGFEVAGGDDHISGFNLGLRLHVTESPEVNTHDIGVVLGIGGFYGT